jgi:hypothetical protein
MGLLVGAGLGGLTANAIDAFVLAYGQRGPVSTTAGACPRQPLVLLPTLDIRKDRASFGCVGTF